MQFHPDGNAIISASAWQSCTPITLSEKTICHSPWVKHTSSDPAMVACQLSSLVVGRCLLEHHEVGGGCSRCPRRTAMPCQFCTPPGSDWPSPSEVVRLNHIQAFLLEAPPSEPAYKFISQCKVTNKTDAAKRSKMVGEYICFEAVTTAYKQTCMAIGAWPLCAVSNLLLQDLAHNQLRHSPLACEHQSIWH